MRSPSLDCFALLAMTDRALVFLNGVTFGIHSTARAMDKRTEAIDPHRAPRRQDTPSDARKLRHTTASRELATLISPAARASWTCPSGFRPSLGRRSRTDRPARRRAIA